MTHVLGDDGLPVEGGVRYPSRVDRARQPIVLVENEVTEGNRYDNWQDVTGERYHFPNQYRRRVIPGREFVYYRGSRRKAGKRGTPEYFGCGVIGQVFADPEVPDDAPASARKWFATIEDFIPFAEPVAAKQGGQYFERIAMNHWSVGVRLLPVETFLLILQLAHVEKLKELAPGELIREAPPLERVRPLLVEPGESLLVVPKRRPGAEYAGSASHGRSNYSKAVGDRAESVVMEFLRETLPAREKSSLRWPAQENEYPGWDIQYSTSGGVLRAIEVKGTRGPKFPGFELTSNEWRAANEKRADYSVVLVARCLSAAPHLEDLSDPVGLAARGLVVAEPGSWRLTRAGGR